MSGQSGGLPRLLTSFFKGQDSISKKNLDLVSIEVYEVVVPEISPKGKQAHEFWLKKKLTGDLVYTYMVSAKTIQQTINRLPREHDSIGKLIFSYNKHVRTSHLKLDSNVLCDARVGIVKLIPDRVCVVTDASTISGLPFWEWVDRTKGGKQPRGDCYCGQKHKVLFDSDLVSRPDVLAGQQAAETDPMQSSTPQRDEQRSQTTAVSEPDVRQPAAVTEEQSGTTNDPGVSSLLSQSNAAPVMPNQSVDLTAVGSQHDHHPVDGNYDMNLNKHLSVDGYEDAAVWGEMAGRNCAVSLPVLPFNPSEKAEESVSSKQSEGFSRPTASVFSADTSLGTSVANPAIRRGQSSVVSGSGAKNCPDDGHGLPSHLGRVDSSAPAHNPLSPHRFPPVSRPAPEPTPTAPAQERPCPTVSKSSRDIHYYFRNATLDRQSVPDPLPSLVVARKQPLPTDCQSAPAQNPAGESSRSSKRDKGKAPEQTQEQTRLGHQSLSAQKSGPSRSGPQPRPSSPVTEAHSPHSAQHAEAMASVVTLKLAQADKELYAGGDWGERTETPSAHWLTDGPNWHEANPDWSGEGRNDNKNAVPPAVPRIPGSYPDDSE